MHIIGEYNNKPVDEYELFNSQVLFKANGMVAFINIRQIRDAFFHTSKGPQTLDIKLFTISAIKGDDVVEGVVSGAMGHALRTGFRIKSENIHFDDVLSFLELNCDYRGIDLKVEHIIKSR